MYQVKEVKISTALTALYSIAHCQKWKFFQNAVTFWSMIICLLTVTTVHKSCEIVIMYIFHQSTFQTLLQLSRFSIWKVNPSLRESCLEFWCNV